MWPFGRRQDGEEDARRLRTEALKARMFGQFDVAYKLYKRALPVYERVGDVDAQCSVLCGLAETTPRREEIGRHVERIQTLCNEMTDSGERAKALGNLDALRQRLNESRAWG
ncbi:MAG: hypothetical protein GY854_19450 [Deltaproteobacteria bacterium]|nr:hypothetical protein [Deltaproteobacteria bacterium]